jgi:hypothetical protein
MKNVGIGCYDDTIRDNSTKMNNIQDSNQSAPPYYDDEEFKSIVDNHNLNNHMGLQDVLEPLIHAVVKRRDDYDLRYETPYTPSAGPITFAKALSRFLKWWNDTRTHYLSTLYRCRRLPEDTDRKVLSSRSIMHLSKLKDFDGIDAWLRELTTRNKDFTSWTICSWTHIKHLVM